MPIKESDGKFLFVRLELSADDILNLLRKHAREYPGADVLEQVGEALIKDGFEPIASAAFVQRVCKWGGDEWLANRLNEMHRVLAPRVRALDPDSWRPAGQEQ